MNFIKRHSELIIASSCFLLIIFLYLFCGINDKLFLGLLGTVATLYFGSIKYRIENDKLFKELFQEFNSRYDIRFNDLINELKYDSNREINNDERNLIIDYLNLCSEEYLWRSKNRIPRNVWISWKAGIIENLKINQVKNVYENEILSENGKKSFYGLIDELAQKNNIKR